MAFRLFQRCGPVSLLPRVCAQIATRPWQTSVPRANMLLRFALLDSRRGYHTAPHLIRNCAIIAHVDHGKTTLVDELLLQAGAVQTADRIMDNNDLEKERGITIMSKNTSLIFGDNQINIVDTPGHGDFSGEVERVLTTVDGVVLVVDASEGPMAQTKFVLSKALQAGLKPIVVLNKMDRDTIRPDEVESEIFDLFAALGATNEQLSYPTLYASAKHGWCTLNRADVNNVSDLNDLYKTIVQYVPPPKVEPDGPFRMLITNLTHDNFFGRILVGRVQSGQVRTGDVLHVMKCDGSDRIVSAKVQRVLANRGCRQVEIEVGGSGDIVGIAGFPDATATDTAADLSVTEPLFSPPIDPPVVSMLFGPNTSPLAGKEGTMLTSSAIAKRLLRETDNNVSISVQKGEGAESHDVRGRGELQLGVLIENMRREGFELSVSPPQVIYKYVDGERLEPIEELTVDVEVQYSGTVMEMLSLRNAELQEMKQMEGNKTRLTFFVPARSLIGLRAELNTKTSGSAVLNHLFKCYEPYKGPLGQYRKGSLVSMSEGKTTGFALDSLQARGQLFVGVQTSVYEGMVIGENSRETDMDVNPVRAKQLTNIRQTGKEEGVRLTPPKLFRLEEALCWIKEDELLEVTPQSIRIRKKNLSKTMREKGAKR